MTTKNTIMRHVTPCSLIGIEITSRVRDTTFCETVFLRISFVFRSLPASYLAPEQRYDSVNVEFIFKFRNTLLLLNLQNRGPS